MNGSKSGSGRPRTSLPGRAPDHVVAFQQRGVEHLTALGPAQRHASEHVHVTVMQQRPWPGAATESALVRDPQVKDSGLTGLR